jgi:virginiamycin B lyase
MHDAGSFKWIAVSLLILPAVSAQRVGVGVYSIPTYFSTPIAITTGSDGALWFTESTGCKVGRITTPGYITEFPLTQVGCSYWITAGPDGALWLTADGIARMATDGTVTPYPAAAGLGPAQITSGPDGALWFTEFSANKIGRMTTAGMVTEYPVPTANSGPIGIASGPDGALWFTEFYGNKVGRISTAGSISEYAVPTAISEPWGRTGWRPVVYRIQPVRRVLYQYWPHQHVGCDH